MRALSIMVLGTSSHVGKSVFAAALCRILVQDGYRVAPFKSQNMSLNSAVTYEERFLKGYFRVAVRTQKDNARLTAAIEQALCQ